MAINPEIVGQIVDAVSTHAQAIWGAGSAAVAQAAKELGRGALSKLGGELAEGLVSRLRKKSKDVPKNRAEIEAVVHEVLKSDPAFAQQVQFCFYGPVAYGGPAMQFVGPAQLQFGALGVSAAAATPAPAPVPAPKALLYAGIAEPLVEAYRSWLVTAPEHHDPHELEALLGKFPYRETAAYGLKVQRDREKTVVAFRTPQAVPPQNVAKLVHDWAGEAPKELQTGRQPSAPLDSREFVDQLRGELQDPRIQVITRFGLTLQLLQRDLMRLKPEIVLLSCHGTKHGDLILEDGRGQASVMPGDWIFEVFNLLKPRPQVLFLDACHSEAVLRRAKHQADWSDMAIVSVNSASPIEVPAGVQFQSMFFQRLLDGAPVMEAFDAAKLFLRNSETVADLSFGTGEKPASERFCLNDPGREVQLSLKERADDVPPGFAPGPRLLSTRVRHGKDRFVGRHRERVEIIDTLLPLGPGISRIGADRRRLVTLTKEGGIGKTAMAAELSDWLHERGLFPAGVFEISCEDFRSPDELLSALLTAFAVQPESQGGDLFALLQEAVLETARNGSRALLVIDNLDDLIGKHAEKDLRDQTKRIFETLLGSSPNLHILATCRWPLGLGQDEAEIPVGPLSEEDSRDVFLSHLAQAEHELEARQTWEQPDSPIRRLIELAGRHPHSLQLLARQVGRPGMNLAKLAKEARENLLGTLTDPLDTRNEDDRRLKVERSFELSYRHLSEEAKQVFALLRYFPGGVWFGDPVEKRMEWEKVLGEDWKLIFEKELDYYALVHVERDPSRLGAGFYRMLPAMVELSLGKTQAEGADEVWTNKWAEFWREHLSTWNQFVSGKMPENLTEGLGEQERAVAGGQWQGLGVRLLGGTQGNWLELFEFAHKNDPELCKWILLEVRSFIKLTGQRLLGKAMARSGVAAARQADEDELLAPCLGTLGNVQSDLGEREAGRDSYVEALEIYRRLAAYEPDVATTLNNLGNVQSDLGEREAARASYEEALTMRRRLAARHPAAYEPDLATTLNNLGIVQSDLGERGDSYVEALEIYRRLAARHPAAYEPDVAMTLNNLGVVQSDLGEREASRDSYVEALEIRRRLAAEHPAAYEADLAATLNNLGVVQSGLGEREAARASYRESLELYLPFFKKYPQAYVQGILQPLRAYTTLTPFSEDDPWWQLWKHIEDAQSSGESERES